MSSVIFFDNDMQDCVIKLRKWYRTAVAEGFLCFFLRKLAEANAMQMLCNHFLHIIHSLDASFNNPCNEKLSF